MKFRHRHGIAFIVSPISEEESGIGWQNHASDLAFAMSVTGRHVATFAKLLVFVFDKICVSLTTSCAFDLVCPKGPETHAKRRDETHTPLGQTPVAFLLPVLGELWHVFC